MSIFYSLRIFESTPETIITEVNHTFMLNKDYDFLIDQLMMEVEEGIHGFCFDSDFTEFVSCVEGYGIEIDKSQTPEDQAWSVLKTPSYTDRKKVVDAFYEYLNLSHEAWYLIEEHLVDDKIIDTSSV